MYISYVRGSREGRYLGVDMGGSKTRAYLMRAPASPRTWHAPGGNLALDPEAALHVLLPLVREAAPTRACLGLAGARTVPVAVAWLAEELERQAGRVTLMTDADLALTAAFGTDADGIVVCAGTGSVAVVRREGATHLIGGHGFLLDDAGSAYDIGKRLIGAALRDRDRGGQTLVHEVEAVLGDSIDAFVRRAYAQPADRQPLARLAEKVPAMQHPAAREILTDAAEALADLARTAQERFGPLPVRLVGGVCRIPVVSETLRRRCGAALARTRPEVAAARLAAEAGA
jgi:N-acetylglucosamine kinase-like BadF-type ATPase